MIKISGVSGTAIGNIKQQESLQEVMRKLVDGVGVSEVAEKLGITVDDLNHRMHYFSDLTLTEIRYLAIAVDCGIQYYVSLNGANPSASITVASDKKEEETKMSE